jgi:phosphopantothenoylcysteine decarboxylase/phosphopantothenate--cysteine ligase
MRTAIAEEFPAHDGLIMSAAVADARPVTRQVEKIKKENLSSIELTSNVDILAAISKTKRANQVLVGFAAETSSDSVELGKEKLLRKGADLLYVNNVAENKIFGSDQTSGVLLSNAEVVESFQDVDKHHVARSIINSVANRLEQVNG